MSDPIVWTEQAVGDLKAIHDFIARDAATYAELLAEGLLEAAERLADEPQLGTVVPEAPEQPVRQLVHGPYRLLYRQVEGDGATVQVLAVCPGHGTQHN